MGRRRELQGLQVGSKECQARLSPREDTQDGSYFQLKHQYAHVWNFPHGPEVNTGPSNAGGVGLLPGQGAKIPHDWQPKNQNIKHRNNIVTNSIKALKMVHSEKKKKNLNKNGHAHVCRVLDGLSAQYFTATLFLYPYDSMESARPILHHFYRGPQIQQTHGDFKL